MSASATVPRPVFHERRKIGLNFSSGPDLRQTIVGNDTRVDLIKETRMYSSWSDFVARLTPLATARGTPNAAGLLNAIDSTPNAIPNDVTERAMWRNLLDGRLEVLKRQSDLRLRACNIAPGIAPAALDAVMAAIDWRLPPELVDFYREMNGVELSWSLGSGSQEIFGSIVVLSLEKAIFGFSQRIAREQYRDAFRDSLWAEDSFSAESIAELREHRVFEMVEGEPAWVTFKPPAAKTRLFFVYEEDIAPIQVTFARYLQLIIEYLGAARIREHLAREDWESQLRDDEKLVAVRTRLPSP